MVQIVGTATHPQFQKLRDLVAPLAGAFRRSPGSSSAEAFNQQPLGLLGTWDSRSCDRRRLRPARPRGKADGNYEDSDPRRILVTNTRAEPSPTPDANETLEPLPTDQSPSELPATPTSVVAPTAAESPTPEATPTPEPETTLLPTVQPGSTSGTAATGSLTDQLFSGQQLLSTAKKAALYTAAFFAALGAFFAVKALLAWLWQKMRP